MTSLQKGIKYLAMAFAVCLAVTIIGGILGMAGMFGGSFSSDAVSQEKKTYTVSSEIHNLQITINAADLSLKEGERFSVESNLKHLTVEEKDGCLIIKQTKKFSTTYTGAVLTVCVPAGTVFDKVALTTGAGRLTAEKLCAETLDFELGAGEVSVGSLIAAKSADIEGGAGRVTIADGVLKNLDLDMGVGQLKLTAVLTGNCSLDMGVGASDIILVGDKADYKLEIEKGIGRITVDGKAVSDYGSSGNGANKVEITGGIGAVNVYFRDEKEA